MNTPLVPRRKGFTSRSRPPTQQHSPTEAEPQSLAPLIDPAGLPEAVSIEDWVDLLGAIEARLSQSVAEQVVGSHALELPAGAGRVQASVMECVSALNQLHGTLQTEVARRQAIELQLFDAQTSLAQLRSELAGTRDGEKRARHLALHDSLTALPNRNFFLERLDGTLAQTPPLRQAFAVLYLDLDGFKAINDEHGHSIGDQLLGIVAQRLHRSIRAEDMVSRLGGDEFACLVIGLSSRQQLCRLAAYLFDVVSAPVRIGELRLVVRPSIGVAQYPDDGVTADGLIKQADAAMYRAKREQTGYAFSGQCSGD
ncbi:MAG: GGDEF domain-containing protein [Cytophagales bacterium]|nr:GGDEF domain-containing protein [Rhizobacter sp.]